MSAPTAGVSPALGAINQALEPKWVRDGSATTQKTYETALAFEQTLVEQLSQSLTKTSGLAGETGEEGAGSSEESSGAGDSELSSLLPQSLTSGVMSAGGLGLAAQLTRDLESSAGVAPSHASSTSGTTGASGGAAA